MVALWMWTDIIDRDKFLFQNVAVEAAISSVPILEVLPHSDQRWVLQCFNFYKSDSWQFIVFLVCVSLTTKKNECLRQKAPSLDFIRTKETTSLLVSYETLLVCLGEVDVFIIHAHRYLLYVPCVCMVQLLASWNKVQWNSTLFKIHLT